MSALSALSYSTSALFGRPFITSVTTVTIERVQFKGNLGLANVFRILIIIKITLIISGIKTMTMICL